MLKTNTKKAIAITSCVLAACLAVPLVGCSGGDNSTDPDARYAKTHNLQAPNTTEAEDGTILHAPEGYVPAYQNEQENNEVVDCKVGTPFTVGNIEYTVYAPSRVHASTSLDGTDSFLVDVEMKPVGSSSSEDDAAQSSGGTTMFFFSPDGLYANDLIEQARQEEQMQKIMEYERNEQEVPQDLYESMYATEMDTVIKTGQPATRTVELSYRGDGTYTVEVRDFKNNKLYRVPLDIKLNS